METSLRNLSFSTDSASWSHCKHRSGKLLAEGPMANLKERRGGMMKRLLFTALTIGVTMVISTLLAYGLSFNESEFNELMTGNMVEHAIVTPLQTAAESQGLDVSQLVGEKTEDLKQLYRELVFSDPQQVTLDKIQQQVAAKLGVSGETAKALAGIIQNGVTNVRDALNEMYRDNFLSEVDSQTGKTAIQEIAEQLRSQGYSEAEVQEIQQGVEQALSEPERRTRKTTKQIYSELRSVYGSTSTLFMAFMQAAYDVAE